MTIVFKMKADNKLEKLLKDVENEKLPPVVKKYATAIRAESQANIQKAGLIDTGAMMNGMIEEPIDERNWTIHDQVKYGVFQELGTSRGIPAHHFLGNACEKLADKFFGEIKDALK